MASIKKLIASLEALESALDKYPDDRKFSDQYGWQAPPLDKNDLEYLVSIVRLKFEDLDFTNANYENAQFVLDDLAAKCDVLTATHVPNLFSGEKASEAILGFIYAAEAQIGSVISSGDIKGVLVIPNELRQNVGVAQKRLKQALDGLEGIEGSLLDIKAAKAAADNLPLTVSTLEDALRDATTARDDSAVHESAAKASADEASRILLSMAPILTGAESVLGKANAAYRAATSQGLARSFSKKAAWLNLSIILWAILLLSALLLAGWLSYLRFPDILKAASGTPVWGSVVVHAVLGMLTVGPPLWLAWVATMQIGQRFRLAEDYGYKAALAAAYEGYRAEAAHLDPIFSAQLFSIALNRLDELPIRLVDKHVAGSPLHELLKSPEFKEAIEKVPSLKDRIVEMLRAATPGTSKGTGAPPDPPIEP